MNIIPKIRQGEEISIEKLNAIIDKVNGIEASKQTLETLQNKIQSDMEKNNAILECIKASQNSIQQIAQSDSLETLTQLLQKFIFVNTNSAVKQRWRMTNGEDNTIIIYLDNLDDNYNIISSSSFTINHGSKGDKGDKGDPGIKGDPGPRGAIGPRGFRGVTGKQGIGAAISAGYVNYVDDTSRLPSTLEQYIRIQVKNIDSDGVETLEEPCYIPTQGYIYIPEVYYKDNDAGTAYIRFKKIENTTVNAAMLLDSNWKITGPQGQRGPKGDTGVPGSGLTCSNLVRLTDSHIFTRNATAETLENLVTADEQDAFIAKAMTGISTGASLFGIMPVDTENPDTATKFTFIEKHNDSWKLLRGTNFPVSNTQVVDVHTSNVTEPKLENTLSQALVINDTTYYKLLVGASFLHASSLGSEFITNLYTVYNRPCIDTITNDSNTDSSYYILVRSTINAGIAVPKIDVDNFTCNNLTLPTNSYEYNEALGTITASRIILSPSKKVLTSEPKTWRLLIENEFPDYIGEDYETLYSDESVVNSRGITFKDRVDQELAKRRSVTPIGLRNGQGIGLEDYTDYFKFWNIESNKEEGGSKAQHVAFCPSTNRLQDLGAPERYFNRAFLETLYTDNVIKQFKKVYVNEKLFPPGDANDAWAPADKVANFAKALTEYEFKYERLKPAEIGGANIVYPLLKVTNEIIGDWQHVEGAGSGNSYYWHATRVEGTKYFGDCSINKQRHLEKLKNMGLLEHNNIFRLYLADNQGNIYTADAGFTIDSLNSQTVVWYIPQGALGLDKPITIKLLFTPNFPYSDDKSTLLKNMSAYYGDMHEDNWSFGTEILCTSLLVYSEGVNTPFIIAGIDCIPTGIFS